MQSGELDFTSQISEARAGFAGLVEMATHRQTDRAWRGKVQKSCFLRLNCCIRIIKSLICAAKWWLVHVTVQIVRPGWCLKRCDHISSSVNERTSCNFYDEVLMWTLLRCGVQSYELSETYVWYPRGGGSSVMLRRIFQLEKTLFVAKGRRGESRSSEFSSFPSLVSTTSTLRTECREPGCQHG